MTRPVEEPWNPHLCRFHERAGGRGSGSLQGCVAGRGCRPQAWDRKENRATGAHRSDQRIALQRKSETEPLSLMLSPGKLLSGSDDSPCSLFRNLGDLADALQGRHNCICFDVRLVHQIAK